MFAVVLNWNLQDDTMECVDSLLASSYSRLHIVVVDNGSDDGSGPALAARYGRQIDLILNRENLGFAAGMNIGIRHALGCGADSVLLLNNDTVIGTEAIEHLLQVSESDAAIGVLGPAVYFYDEPDRFWRLGAVHNQWSPLPIEIGRGEMDQGQFAAPFEVDYVTGCAMWIRAELLRQVGLLDEGYYMYYEDADFCRRAHNAGYRIVVTPQAHVWHKVSRSAERKAANSHYHRTRYRIRFYRMHRPGPFPMLTLGVLCVQELGRIGKAALRGQLDIVQAGWRGLIDGSREELDQPSGTGCD